MRNRILAKLRMPDGTINPWVVAVTVTLATFMEVLDTSIANVALPHIAGNLSAGADESTWVLTSYLVSNAIVLPLSGWFSGLIGRKNFYMACVAPSIGPWLGGWITDNFSWRWIFYVNVPVGLISLVLTNFLVSDPPYMKKASLKAGFRIDYIGIGLISLGLGSMQIVLDKGQREDWF